MGRVRRGILVLVMAFLAAVLCGCRSGGSGSGTAAQTEAATEAPNGLMNGWLSTYDVSMNEYGLLYFDWSRYQPATGVAVVYAQRQGAPQATVHTSAGNTLLETVERGMVWRFAVWYGEASRVAAVQQRAVPETAWRYMHIGPDGTVLQTTRDRFDPADGPAASMIPAPATPVPTMTPVPTPVPTPAPTPVPTAVPDWSWHLQFLGINTSETDNYSREPVLRVGDTVYFHAWLTGGAPNETLLPVYEVRMNGDLIERNSFSGRVGSGSYVWVRNIPQRYGTLSVTLYYTDGYGRQILLGSAAVQIEARTEETPTGVAQGWISGCDVYFNRYGSLCFDMTGYEPEGESLIYFRRNDHESATAQGAVSEGQVVWDTPVPGWVYEYAIWSGSPEYAGDAAALTAEQIPAAAWIRLRVTEDRGIVILSSGVAVRIRENE